MKFLFRSSDGLCLPQALRVEAEGNRVKMSIDMASARDCGDGLVEKVLNLDAAIDWADVVVYDVQNGPLPDEADKVRLKKPVIGTSALGGRLEHDRGFGIEVARSVGIPVADVQEFKGGLAFVRAREFLAGKPREESWVFKVNKKAPQNVGTYVAKEGRAEMLRMLGYIEHQYIKEGVQPNFILTKKIEGTEISTEAWFNGTDFWATNHTIERTKFFPGDLGEKTGCAGNVVWPAPDSPLYHKLLAPLRSTLEGQFVGPLDINVIIDKVSNLPTFLEFSPRFGYDAIFALMELFEQDFGEFLYAMATGQQWLKPLREIFAGDVRVTVPPFPAKEAGDEAIGLPVFGYDAREFDRHIHPIELTLDKDNKTVTCGPHGIPLSVSGVGNTPREAQDAAYRVLDGIHIPNMRYRNDLADVISDIYESLAASGWLAPEKGNVTKKVEWPKPRALQSFGLGLRRGRL
jgi:phosphoribosylamine---glycine ligase